MYHDTSIIPDSDDPTPRGRMGGRDSDIPVLELTPGDGRFTVQFSDYDVALRWLDALLDAAYALGFDIRARQRQLNGLLEAVEASPGGEG